MKTIKTLVLILTTILFITACKKDESTNLWDISGKVTLKDAEVESITNMEGVKVYLLNAPFSMDTINGFFAADDILEVTQTSATGQYSFTDLLPGDYIVLPADTVNNYIFNWQESPDSIWMEASNTKSSYTINFSASLTIPDNASNDYNFTMFGYMDPTYRYTLDMILFQKARTRFGHGWLGLSPGSWYYQEQEELTFDKPVSFKSILYNIVFEYQKEFCIKFYNEGEYFHTEYLVGTNYPLAHDNVYEVTYSMTGNGTIVDFWFYRRHTQWD